MVQMILVISSPSKSTIGLSTLILFTKEERIKFMTLSVLLLNFSTQCSESPCQDSVHLYIISARDKQAHI